MPLCFWCSNDLDDMTTDAFNCLCGIQKVHRACCRKAQELLDAEFLLNDSDSEEEYYTFESHKRRLFESDLDFT